MISGILKAIRDTLITIPNIEDVVNITSMDKVSGTGTFIVLETINDDRFKDRRDSYILALRVYIYSDDPMKCLNLKWELDKKMDVLQTTGLDFDVLYCVKEKGIGSSTFTTSTGKYFTYNVYSVVTKGVE